MLKKSNYVNNHCDKELTKPSQYYIGYKFYEEIKRTHEKINFYYQALLVFNFLQ
jgi:hypothetical protein